MAQVTVAEGNTLSQLAQQYGTTVDAFASTNNISNTDMINVGQVLQIPDTPTAPPLESTQVSPTIGAGELSNTSMPIVPPDSVEGIDNQIGELLAMDFSAPEQEQQASLENTLLSLTQELESESAEGIRLENELGIPGLNAELKGINDDIRMKAAALRQGLVDEQGRVIPLGLLRGRQQELKYQTAAEIEGLQAYAQVIQGNIQLANDKIQKSLDLKYRPKEARINTILQALSINESRLSAKEKEFARKQQNQLTQLQTKLQREETEEREVKSLALTLATNQAPDEILSKSFGSKSIEEIMKIPGVQKYLQSPMEKLDYAIKNTQLATARAEQRAIEEARKSGLLTKDQAKQATDLRKEYNNLESVKGVNKSETDTKSIVSALASGKPTDDIAAINSFQRIAVDPGVAVREGDVALLQSAMSFGDKTWLRTNGYLKGNKLTPQAREDMQKLALEIHDARINSVIDQTAPIRATAQVYAIPFDEYIGAPLKRSSAIIEEVSNTQLTPEKKSQNYTSSIMNTLYPESQNKNSVFNSSFSDLFKQQ